MSQRFHGTVGEWLGALSADQGGHFAVAYRHGTMSVELAAPRHPDTQQPHAQDEIYFVVSGSGWFLNGDVRHRFDAGDVLFVPAGVVHRFEEHTEDTLVWVVFYGRRVGRARVSPVTALQKAAQRSGDEQPPSRRGHPASRGDGFFRFCRHGPTAGRS